MVDRQAVQPRAEGAFPAKGSQLAKYLDEDLLRQIFRLGRTPSHSQTHGKDFSDMKLEEFLERQQFTSYHFFIFDWIVY
jgi:hypothetical protein